MTQKQPDSPKTLGTESYKGVRDFFPEDMRAQKHIFEIMRRSVESYGYEEYGASILEPSELYEAKSGEEIVNEQTYTFTDRGGRKVTLRPEMTPTVARMISQKSKILSLPVRWYSIPNLFRYEQPQKGRLREHFQLNVDIFGVADISAEIELIALASRLMKNFGAEPNQFVIRINSRKIVAELYAKYGIDGDRAYRLSKIIDKKNKIDGTTFDKALEEILGKKTDEFKAVLASNKEVVNAIGETSASVQELLHVIDSVNKLGITNIIFDQTLMRGFDYYTGIVFEIFDTHPDNMRSLFGGGRYDELTEMFGSKKIPACGFGAGDVTLKDFLEIHKLLPLHGETADIYVARPDKTDLSEIMKIAEFLRQSGLRVVVDMSGKKTSDQIKRAQKQGIPYVIFIGDEEVKNETYKVKELSTGKETSIAKNELASFFTSKK